MNFTQQFVALTVATLKADGHASMPELAAIKFLADELKLDADEVDACIREEAHRDQDIETIARGVADSDKDVILDSCAMVALSDNVLSEVEVSLVFRIANALGVTPSSAVLSIASIVQRNAQIKILRSSDEEPDVEDTCAEEI